MFRSIFTFLILIFSTCQITYAEPLRLPGKPNDKKLHLTLVQEIVNRSSRFDEIEFVYQATGEPAQSRVMADLESGEIDLYWSATSLDMEKRFAPILFPIYRGMLGMRIGLIHEKDKQLLANVRSKADFTRFKVCSGKTWPDTFILDANGIKTAKSLKYPNIFEMMLAGNRCHLFARGVMEPFAEMQSYPELPLAVDSHVMLRYRMPYMLFVQKENTKLQQHITEVVEEIFADGTYEKLFFEDSEVRMALSRANLSERTIIDLENPYLTEDTRSIPEKYFFDPLAN
ncbi:ABC transporter substrate-binding protein [Vibrio sp. 10N.222.51.C8]|uniref:ABC transporter substrate-binding protein n=1 Tax=unclassified Vibrio TaxID=2614977 RepID=UPI000C833CE8|nr:MULTISPECIES: ABC transporter substrate-binding protein [unclassified Vibrio]PMK27211.1 ABC transporter substrate-binding protein [Vibrio sp. 10N.261.54.C3]PMO01076.1 ABC transporter substrate-binding protein [Vibrio sp. 10N.222.55.C12]PMO16371.1 ABC transporter substrate-binding protein [Vibrio sp. 10N.222.54.F10]PMO17646.1 ABC transporter substrate-binding protein [Vibrio sp. 10N.222.54.B6]TKF40966.1 amino acid ABC transporter substrate-binding protein [Vibrio sp. F13]